MRRSPRRHKKTGPCRSSGMGAIAQCFFTSYVALICSTYHILSRQLKHAPLWTELARLERAVSSFPSRGQSVYADGALRGSLHHNMSSKGTTDTYCRLRSLGLCVAPGSRMIVDTAPCRARPRCQGVRSRDQIHQSQRSLRASYICAPLNGICTSRPSSADAQVHPTPSVADPFRPS